MTYPKSLRKKMMEWIIILDQFGIQWFVAEI